MDWVKFFWMIKLHKMTPEEHQAILRQVERSEAWKRKTDEDKLDEVRRVLAEIEAAQQQAS